jgi:hypothetical protein
LQTSLDVASTYADAGQDSDALSEFQHAASLLSSVGWQETHVSVTLFNKIAQSNARGVVPRLVNYCGKAVDSQGKTLMGVAGVTFAIYKDQTDGAPLWLETQKVQADARAKFTPFNLVQPSPTAWR